jgi:hypothetical protein
MLPDIGALRGHPVDLVGDRMGSDFEPAMALLGSLRALELIGRCRIEITLDVGMKGRLVVLHGQKVVGLGIKDALRNVRIASHGINRDQGAFEVDAFHERRDGGDLVGFFVGRLLTQHELASGGERRDQMQGLLPALTVVAAPRGLAVEATRSGGPGQHSATHDEKQAANRSGSTRFMTVRSQSAQGMP